MSEIVNKKTFVVGSGNKLLKNLEELSGRGVREITGEIILDYSIDAERGIVFALLDISYSMEGDALSQAKNGIIEFTKQSLKRRYKVGLIAFGSDARLLAKPCDDLIKLSEIIHNISSDGSTNMSDAIALATTLLSEKHKGVGKKRMCVVTDGSPNDPSRALCLARKAEKFGIKISAIGTNRADPHFLNMLATKKSYGKYVKCDNFQKEISNMSLLLE